MGEAKELLRGLGLGEAEVAGLGAPALGGELERDWRATGRVLKAAAGILPLLPEKARRSAGEQAAAAALLAEARGARQAFLRRHAAALYGRLTGGRSRFLRFEELVRGAAREWPELVPTAEQVAADRRHPQMHQDGVQIDEGLFLAHVLADAPSGMHLLHAMARPTPAALERLERFRATGRESFPSMTLERQGTLGRITFHHQAWLNAEDDEYQEALETLVDLVLLDPAIDVGVLRGAPMTKAKYAGRRVFGSGINLTQLYHGKISFLRFMMNREAGPLTKMLRGLTGDEYWDSDVEDRVEKPFIGAVDAFAIGGHCQILLVLDRVIAQRGSWFNLPARKEGIIPGLADLRLPRFVGERATRQGIFFNREFQAESPAGLLICDQIVEGEEAMEAAVAASSAELTSAGKTSLVANRRALRVGSEPLDLFRRYLAVYAREQAYCLYSDALIDNLVRNWKANERKV